MTQEGPARRLGSEVGGYVMGKAASVAVAAAVGIVVARYLGPADLGLLGFVTSIYMLAIPIAVLGTRSVLVRNFSVSDEWRRELSAALAHQLPVAVLVSAASFLVVAFSRNWDATAVLTGLALLPLPLLALRDSVQALHESKGHVSLVVSAAIVAALAAAALKLLGVRIEAPVHFFAAATTVEALIVFVALGAGLVKRLGRPLLIRSFDRLTGRALLRESWPLLVASLAVTVYMRVDVTMLGLLAGDTETGLYVAAARISEVWYFVPIAGMAAIRPRLARTHATGDVQRYRAETRSTLSAAWVVSLAAVVATLVLADAIVAVLYGEAFEGTETILRIHVLAAPFVFLGVASSQWFIDQDLNHAYMRRAVGGALSNIALNLVLIPTFGAMGAAISTLVSYGLSGVLLNAFSGSTRPLFLMQLRALTPLRRQE